MMARHVRYFTSIEDYIFSIRIYKEIAFHGETFANALDAWVSRKGSFERDAELDSTAVARC